MSTIIKPTLFPDAPTLSNNVRPALETILHIDLALSLARRALIIIDRAVQLPFSATLEVNAGNNAVITLIAGEQVIFKISEALVDMPNLAVGNNELRIGLADEPCVYIRFE
jgi:hypothetical protein